MTNADVPKPKPPPKRPDAFLCGPKPPTDADLEAVELFSRMLAGERGCLICMAPDSACPGDGTCCGDCIHGILPRRSNPRVKSEG